MKLTVLGCAGSFPGPDSACSSYLVEAGGFRLLLDFGTGSLSALQRYASLTAVDAILITHLHADHMFDACSYSWCAGTRPTARTRQSRCMGRPARGNDSAPPTDPARGHSMTCMGSTTWPGTFEIGPLTVTVDRVNHPVETYGVRIEHDGRVLAYSADTAACDALNRLAKGADLFLCEASYVDGEENPRTCTSLVAMPVKRRRSRVPRAGAHAPCGRMGQRGQDLRGRRDGLRRRRRGRPGRRLLRRLTPAGLAVKRPVRVPIRLIAH